MEEKRSRVELSGFIPEETNLPVRAPRAWAGRSTGPRRSAGARAKHKRTAQEQPFDATSMLIKCGICAAACALVLLLKWIGAPATDSALQTVKDAVSEESELDEMLGKLKFVELPGILEVFSSSGKMQPPIDASGSESLRDGTLLALTADAEQNVTACLEGSVKETGSDKELGSYVRIVSKDDKELYLYGLAGISVEMGQPLLGSDYVGSIEAGGTLYIGLSVKGKPENPAGYFSLPAETV